MLEHEYELYTEAGMLRFFRERFPAQRVYKSLRKRSRWLGEGIPLEFRPEWEGLAGFEALEVILPAFYEALRLPAEEGFLERALPWLIQMDYLTIDPQLDPQLSTCEDMLQYKMGDLLEEGVWRKRALERGVPEAWAWGWKGWDWERIDLALEARVHLEALGLGEYIRQPPQEWPPLVSDDPDCHECPVPFWSEEDYTEFFRRFSRGQA